MKEHGKTLGQPATTEDRLSSQSQSSQPLISDSADARARDIEAEAASRRDIADARERLRCWGNSGVGIRHHCKVNQWAAGGDGPHGSRWLKARENITSRLDTASGTTLALIGPRGTGKTQLAACAIHAVSMTAKAGEWIREDDDATVARYATFIDIIRAVKATFSSRHDSESDVIAGFVRPALLVIDECHVGCRTEHEHDMLTDLIDRRYRCFRDTILISNQTESEFIKSIGSSVHDRLIETGGLIVCDWPSYRNPN